MYTFECKLYIVSKIVTLKTHSIKITIKPLFNVFLRIFLPTRVFSAEIHLIDIHRWQNELVTFTFISGNFKHFYGTIYKGNIPTKPILNQKKVIKVISKCNLLATGIPPWHYTCCLMLIIFLQQLAYVIIILLFNFLYYFYNI